MTHKLFFTHAFVIILSLLSSLRLASSQLPIVSPLPKYTYEQALALATVVQMEKHEERFGSCYTYAVTHHLGIIGQAPQLLKISSSEDLVRDLDVVGNYYQKVDAPCEDNLIVYKNHQNQEPTHFGIVQKIDTTVNECVIKSKWGLNPEILEHKLFETLESYGTDVSFFTLKPEYQNNRSLLLKNIQEKIAQSSYIKKEITATQTMLLHLANGKDITHETNESFNSQEDILLKAFYLLKMCLGLSINTCKATTKETVLMLATKRNDLEMIELFLLMGADKTRKDIHGNTALMIAEKNNFSRAIKLLECDDVNLLT